jgi:hypothetical protein
MKIFFLFQYLYHRYFIVAVMMMIKVITTTPLLELGN